MLQKLGHHEYKHLALLSDFHLVKSMIERLQVEMEKILNAVNIQSLLLVKPKS